jgi:hypothetical protein
MTKWLRVKNWERFQHYRKRNPPWIKLHRSILDDDRVKSLPLGTQMVLIYTWVVASIRHGVVPSDGHYWRGYLAISKPRRHLQRLVDKGFLIETSEDPASIYASIRASKMLYPEYRDRVQTPTSPSHRNASTEPLLTPSAGPAETGPECVPKKRKKTANGNDPSDRFLAFWDAWPRHHRKQSRGQCWLIWHKAGLDPVSDQVIAHVACMKDHPQWKSFNGQYIPAPLVYLNQRRWEGADTDPEEPTVAMP